MSGNIYLAGLYLDIRKDITASVSPLSSLENENVEDAEKMEKTETEKRLVQKLKRPPYYFTAFLKATILFHSFF